jgi:hypothetical protein
MSAKHNHIWKRSETERQMFIVYSGVVQGASPTAIRRSLQQEFPRVQKYRYDTLYARVQDQLNQEEKEAGVSRRSEAIRRIQARIQALDTRAREYEHPEGRKPTPDDLRLAKSLFAEARQQDQLLATITGITAPIKIEVEAKVKETVTVLMAMMTPEQISAHLAKYNETLRLADLARTIPALPVAQTNGHTNGHANGITNGVTKKSGGKP